MTDPAAARAVAILESLLEATPIDGIRHYRLCRAGHRIAMSDRVCSKVCIEMRAFIADYPTEKQGELL